MKSFFSTTSPQHFICPLLQSVPVHSYYQTWNLMQGTEFPSYILNSTSKTAWSLFLSLVTGKNQTVVVIQVPTKVPEWIVIRLSSVPDNWIFSGRYHSQSSELLGSCSYSSYQPNEWHQWVWLHGFLCTEASLLHICPKSGGSKTALEAKATVPMAASLGPRLTQR